MSDARPTPIEVVDDRRRRVRSAYDGMRMTAALLSLLLLLGFGTSANQTSAGLNADLLRAVHKLPALITNSLQVLGVLAALAGPIAVVIVQLVRGHLRRLGVGLLTATLATLVTALLAVAIRHADHLAIHHALSLTTSSRVTSPLDPYLAGWLTLIIASGLTLVGALRAAMVAAVVVYMISAFGTAEASVLALVMSEVLGAAIGLSVRYAVGVSNERAPAETIADALRIRDIHLISMTRLAPDSDHRTYAARDRVDRGYWIDVLDRDNVATGWLYRLYRITRLQGEITSGPALSIERVAEQRMLLALAAQSTGARVPRFVAAAECGDRAIALAYEAVTGIPIAELNRPLLDEEVLDLWRNGELLHHGGVSHPRLTPRLVRLDEDGIVLPVLDEGTVVASPLRMDLDRAQVLVTTALSVGPERAVALATDALGATELGKIARVLQPVGLTRETRRTLKAHKSLLEDLRNRLTTGEDNVSETPLRLERVRPRTVIALAGLIVAAWLLIGQLGSVDLITVLRHAKWQWLPGLVAASALTYVAAAVSLQGYVREKLSLVRTTMAQLASSFAGFVLPPALGPVAINLRYLQRCGLSVAAAAASVGTSQVVNGISHALLLAALAAATGRDQGGPTVPGWAYYALGGLAAIALIAVSIPRWRRWLIARIQPMLHDLGPRLVDLIGRPRKLVQAVGGAMLLNAAYILALWCAVRAFNGSPAVLTVAVVYLAGAAIGSVAPTPGGIGAIEVALSTGLATAGMPSTAAVSAVLLYRIATFWLPVPVGWLAMNRLQHARLL
ncbi:MAG: flippase-like domain-containing protein [Actinobacteria bacterium]|nr:flippase-like domain-containing protein [Actinomycetota bacterium]